MADVLKNLQSRTTISPAGCWEYNGIQANEYGHKKVYTGGTKESRRDRAHRASWELHKGPIPPGLCVLHECDNPKCWNPDHLFLGTKQDNTDDMRRKGRMAVNFALPQCRLSEDQVREIRAIQGMTQDAIASSYGCSRAIVSLIRSGKARKHVT